jgi:ATPase subunit of ABC transporter with duplicated ATPase domains
VLFNIVLADIIFYMAKTFDDKKIIYTMDRVSRAYGTKVVLKDISISYYYGAKIGVIGENGAGKSSLFKIFAGIDTDYTGETKLLPGYTMGYLEQEPQLEAGKTVMEIVKEGVKPITDLLAEFDKVNEAFGDPDADFDKLCARQAELQEKLDAADAWNLDANLELAMDALRCPPADQVVDVLSGGERRRVALCRLLLQQPDILLLDEPTNHLDAETVAWLERHLKDYKGTIIAITHDRYFLDNVAGWILEMDRGEGYPFKGNYSEWLEAKQKRLALEEKQASVRQREMQEELEWIHAGAKGRQAKHKEHITKYEALLAEESSRVSSRTHRFLFLQVLAWAMWLSTQKSSRSLSATNSFSRTWISQSRQVRLSALSVLTAREKRRSSSSLLTLTARTQAKSQIQAQSKSERQ